MQAVFSLLPEPYNTQVEQIWDLLKDDFGLSYVHITPIPHITWQLGEGYQEEKVISFCMSLLQSRSPSKSAPKDSITSAALHLSFSLKLANRPDYWNYTQQFGSSYYPLLLILLCFIPRKLAPAHHPGRGRP